MRWSLSSRWKSFQPSSRPLCRKMCIRDRLYPVQVELGDRACIMLFRLTEENGEAAVPAKIESVEYVAPEDVEEKVGGKMTYFDTCLLYTSRCV